MNFQKARTRLQQSQEGLKLHVIKDNWIISYPRLISKLEKKVEICHNWSNWKIKNQNRKDDRV
jgi:hypothetical protein